MILKYVVCGVLACMLTGFVYFSSLFMYHAYWDQKCLRATFLGAAVSYKFEVYCQSDTKSYRIEMDKAETRPTATPEMPE
jgi:hypothetical protein